MPCAGIRVLRLRHVHGLRLASRRLASRLACCRRWVGLLCLLRCCCRLCLRLRIQRIQLIRLQAGLLGQRRVHKQAAVVQRAQVALKRDGRPPECQRGGWGKVYK